FAIGNNGTPSLAWTLQVHPAPSNNTTPPTISGTVANQHGLTTTSEAPVHPFAGVTISDPNTAATDTLTHTVPQLALAGPIGGTTGTLSGSGLSGGTNGVYTLAAAAAATITSELHALVFTPKAGAPGSSTTTTFTLSDLSSADATPTLNTSTTVINTDPAGAPLPDLVVANITPNATSVTQGASFGFSYVVQNVGAAAAGMSWAGIYLDQQTTTLPGGWNQIGALNANASATETNSFSTAGLSVGPHTLWIKADYWNDATGMANSGNNDVVESNENN